MKKIIAMLLFACPLIVSAQKATITIDVAREVGTIDPKMYGVFMEPIHFSGRRSGLSDTVDLNTMYGNLYDPSSPLADDNGFRKDYIDAMKELKIEDMRWPGGNYAMGYNWEDGIGPKDKRPVRVNLAWGGNDNNHVGTDEWVELNKAIGSENVICVNLGLSTIEEACWWVEYCNYKKGTYYSGLRMQYGHKDPYGVKIWDLGNEVDGAPWELGHKSADDYVKIGREAAKAMRAVDNTIDLVGCGSSYYESTGQWVEWNRKILTGLGDMIKYLSIHAYWNWGAMPDYYTYLGERAREFDEKIDVTADEIEAVKAMKEYKHPIYISVDEWGSFGRDFLSVLPVALCFNSFIRHADIVKMANFTMLTSLLGSDRKKGTYKTPLFYTFKLFSNNCRGSSVDTYVQCDTFNTEKYKGIPYLDVSTVYSKETHTIYINVVNRHKDKAITADIVNVSDSLTGIANATVFDCESLTEPFSFEKQQEYVPRTREIKTEGNTMTCSFPAHSFTQIIVKRKN
ncbi:MAG: alpha-N-arabinofuranosidase [Bacteroidota bacterium]|nr:alpha-N-arabinofuranosidase [Bacteroidota bacterium]